MFSVLERFGRGVGLVLVGLLLAALFVVGWAIFSPRAPVTPSPRPQVEAPSPAPTPRAGKPLAACDGPPADPAIVTANASSVDGAAWSPFGRSERGWRIYTGLVQREIGTSCAPYTPGFAHALADWKTAQALGGGGALDEAAFRRMSTGWLLRRPFIQATRGGGCPASPPVDALQEARTEEGYAGKQVAALAPALAAYRAMVARARADSAEIARDPRLLTIFSAYRGPAEEAARCARGGCNRLTMARCSAHRTGTAFDLFVGAAPGSRPESSDDENRRVQAASPAYNWLVANADRYGFLPYPFEPWHWEWAGHSLKPTPAADGSVVAQQTPRMKAQSAR